MKAFRGPVDNLDDVGDITDDDDDEIVPVIGAHGQILVGFLDSDDEIEGGVGIAGQELVLDDFVFGPPPIQNVVQDSSEEEEDLYEIGQNYDPDLEDSSSDEEQDEPDNGNDNESNSPENNPELSNQELEELGDPALEHEHVHGVDCGYHNAPSTPPDPEDLSVSVASSPETLVRRTYGEIDIARRLREEEFSVIERNTAHLVNNLTEIAQAYKAASSSSDLSELSGPESIKEDDLDHEPTTSSKKSPDYLGVPKSNDNRESKESSPMINYAEHENEGDDEDSQNSQHIYSNPMVSDDEDENEPNRKMMNGEGNNTNGTLTVTKVQLRGDCIGSTTYSERHVLKTLIKWMKQVELMQQQQEADSEVKLELESEFDHELSLFWDMTSEADVARYVVEKDVLQLISESLNINQCDRLVEITIGILVNLLSVRDIIIASFKSCEVTYQFLPRILSELLFCRRIPRLIQGLAFLRRVVWYLLNVEIIDSWLLPLTEIEFFEAVNFLLNSCRNICVLSELVTILFMLLQVIRDNHNNKKQQGKGICSKQVEQKDDKRNESEAMSSDKEEVEEEESNLKDECAKNENTFPAEGECNKLAKNLHPPEVIEFCKLGLVTSLCESFQELLKYQASESGLLWSTWNTVSKNQGDDDEVNEDDLPAIPPNGIQESICLGLNAFEYIHQIQECREYLTASASNIIKIYTQFYERFHLYTQNVPSESALDHFGEGLKVVGFYQCKLPEIISKDVIIQPLAAALRFKTAEEEEHEEEEDLKNRKDKDHHHQLSKSSGENIKATTTDNHRHQEDLVSSIILITHEYISQLGDKFGLDTIYKIIQDDKIELSRFLEFINSFVQKYEEKCQNNTEEDLVEKVENSKVVI